MPVIGSFVVLKTVLAVRAEGKQKLITAPPYSENWSMTVQLKSEWKGDVQTCSCFLPCLSKPFIFPLHSCQANILPFALVEHNTLLLLSSCLYSLPFLSKTNLHFFPFFIHSLQFPLSFTTLIFNFSPLGLPFSFYSFPFSDMKNCPGAFLACHLDVPYCHSDTAHSIARKPNNTPASCRKKEWINRQMKTDNLLEYSRLSGMRNSWLCMTGLSGES